MKKSLIFLLSSFTLLVSCGENTAEEKTYTVVWKNYDGTVLETDLNVKENTIPTYDGEKPTKPSDDTYVYTFKDWDPKVAPINADTTYTAIFEENLKILPEEIDAPILSEDGKTVQYGLYPQNHITDETLISKISNATIDSNGFYRYENERYVKQVAATYNDESYTFKDGTPIVNGETYWFKFEHITWNVLKNENDKCFLLAKDLLDQGIYNKTLEDSTNHNEQIHANNYEKSYIRYFLNNNFLNTAFINPDYLISDNKDKVFLPTVEDYLNISYGFSGVIDELDVNRTAKVTEFALCRGAWANKRDEGSIGNGNYWTSSPDNTYSYTAYNINSGGFISSYAVDGLGNSIRPAININLY